MIMGSSALLGVGAGVGARLLTATPPTIDEVGRDPRAEPGEPESEAATKRDGESGKPDAEADIGEKRGAAEREKHDMGGHGAADPKREPQAYYKFSRQFVVPIVVDGRPQAMMVLDVVIALSKEADGGEYSDEPRLRDAVLRALLAQAGAGELQGMLSEPQQLERTRAAILAQVRNVMGENAQSALLMDVAYQPF